MKLFKRTQKANNPALNHRRIVCTYTACVAMAGCVMFDAIAAANVPVADNGTLDLAMLLRFLIGILLAFIAYWTRGIEKRVENTEHELKQQQAQISLMREQMLREYHTKQEVERMAASIQTSLEQMNRRLDFLVRPAHVRRDDEGNDGWVQRGT